MSTGWIQGVLPADPLTGTPDATCAPTDNMAQGALGWEGEGKGKIPLAANLRANFILIASTEKRRGYPFTRAQRTVIADAHL